MPSKYQGIQEQIDKERKKRKIGRKVTRDISPSQFIKFSRRGHAGKIEFVL